MQQFYATEIDEHTLRLDELETRHLSKALRKSAGDLINVADGCGRVFLAEISKITRNTCEAQIIKVIQSTPYHSRPIALAVTPTKNATRFEWVLEKATELGVDEIYPIHTERSERRKINQDRCARIVRAAFKQSLRSWLPKLHEMISLEQFLSKNFTSCKFIAKYSEAHEEIKDIVCQEPATILIGPEGDFTDTEYEKALDAGYKGVNLGPYRLRTETAAVSAVVHLDLKRRH